MGYVEDLQNKSRSPAAIFHRYRVDTSITDTPHIFIEGYDDLLFYGHVANARQLNGAKFHICYGKKNLDKVYALFLSGDLRPYQTMFIRDSDFDRYIGKIEGGPHLFLTKGYAVENYICNAAAVKSLLIRAMGIDESEYDIDSEIRKLCQYVDAIFAWLRPFHGAVMRALEHGRNLDLDKLRFEDHFTHLVRDGDLPQIDKLPELGQVGLTSADFSRESECLAEGYNEQDCFLWLRGKYLLKAIAVFARHLENAVRALHKRGGVRQFNRRVSPDFSASVLLERLLAHTEIDGQLAASMDELSAIA